MNIDQMKYSEVERKLKKEGCTLCRNGKRHPIWYSPITGLTFELSYHSSEEVKPGTLKSISKQSGVKL
jgi:predicted RNA binding protein YcfA (HicA-like mRNA interferase family)